MKSQEMAEVKTMTRRRELPIRRRRKIKHGRR